MKLGDQHLGKLINLIEAKLPKDSGEVEVCLDIQDVLDQAEKKITLGQFMVFCANTGLYFHCKSGRWVLPWFSIKKEGGENVHG